MGWRIPSQHVSWILEENRLFEAQLEAKRAGQWDKARELIVKMQNAQRQRQITWQE